MNYFFLVSACHMYQLQACKGSAYTGSGALNQTEGGIGGYMNNVVLMVCQWGDCSMER